MVVDLFSYRNGNSFLHRIPALVKIFLLIFICVFSFWGNTKDGLETFHNFYALFRIGLSLFLAILLFFLGGAYYKSIKKLCFVLIFGFIVIFFRTFDFSSGSFKVNLNGFFYGLFYTLRFFIAAFSANVIYETTSCIKIKEELEFVPIINKTSFPIVFALAINFIPQCIRTWQDINLAAKAKNPKKSKNAILKIQVELKKLEAFFSCMFFQAEQKRLAILSRS